MSATQQAVKATAAAAKLAEEHDLDLSLIVGSSKVSGIVIGDVRKAIADASEQAADDSADVEDEATSDDRSSDESRQSPAERFAKFAETATAASAADVLDAVFANLSAGD